MFYLAMRERQLVCFVCLMYLLYNWYLHFHFIHTLVTFYTLCLILFYYNVNNGCFIYSFIYTSVTFHNLFRSIKVFHEWQMLQLAIKRFWYVIALFIVSILEFTILLYSLDEFYVFHWILHYIPCVVKVYSFKGPSSIQWFCLWYIVVCFHFYC